MKNRILLILLAITLALSIGLIGCGSEEVPEYNLSISTTEGGEITTPGEGTFSYDQGTEVPLMVFPHTGYCFVEWTGDVGTIANANAASTTIVMNDNYSIAAEFAVGRYNLTIGSTAGGAVTMPGEGTFTYDEGTAVSLVAAPDTGYRFANWSGDIDSIASVNNAATTVSMYDDYHVTANFIAQYVLTIDSTYGGMVVTPDKATSTYDAGTLVTLVAKADEGSGFAKWVGDVSGIADTNSAETTITMDGSYAVRADFGTAIYDWYGLNAVRDNLEGSYVLMNDLDATTAGYTQVAGPTASGGRGWAPVGPYGYWDDQQREWVGEIFKGALYGRGHEIRDMVISRFGDPEIGLFGHVYQAVLEDIGVANSTVTGGVHVGGLVGFSSGGTIRNCYYGGSVSGELSVGALVGYHHGYVTNSYYNYDKVLINGRHIITVGALFDEDFQQWLADGKVLDVNERLSQEDGCYVINNVSDFKQLLAFGQDSSLSFRLKNDIDLSNDANFYIPYLGVDFDGGGHRISNLTLNFGDLVSQVGLFGIIRAQVSDLGVENVMITTGSFQVGGLAGSNMFTGTITRCYSTGTVTQGSGLVGGNWGTIIDSYSTAGRSLTAFNTPEATIRNSYSTRGLTEYNRGTITSSFWDIQTSGQTTSGGGTGKTTTEMKNVATFSGAGWNIVTVANPDIRDPSYIWNIVDGQSYPFLSWQS